MMPAIPMPSIVKTLRMLADPTRLRLLLLLEQEELSVVEIQEILGMGQSRISSQLAQLKQADLVQDRRAGKNIYYRLCTEEFERFKEIVDLSAEEIEETKDDQSALELVIKRRADTAKDYFNKLAGKFGRSYCPGRSWKGVAQMLLTLVGPITVADLGAGEGTISQLLARHAKRVIAIDNSEKMVEFGAALAKEHGFDNLEYRQGDIEEPPIETESVDLVLLSQALHHANNPPRALAAAYRILKPGGRIVILDLLAHNFERARELYADLWLGFSEVDLHRMLKEAGFSSSDISLVSKDEENPQLQTVFATALKAL